MFDVAGTLERERRVERLKDAEILGVNAAMPAVFVRNGPVEHVKISAVDGLEKLPTPVKLRSPFETFPVTTPKLD